MTSWDGGTLDEREYLIVRGTVQQIVYYNDENGYAVLRLAAENGAEVTATGTFPNIGLGEEVILTGCWVTHPTYGEQFATEAFERRLPTSVRGIAEYLGSGLIRGIGPRLAAKIAEKFGEDTFDILMHEPERLSELRGITDRKAKEIGRQFTEQSEMRLRWLRGASDRRTAQTETGRQARVQGRLPPWTHARARQSHDSI